MSDELQTMLESVDRELAFYRRRAGQVFFFGLLVEAAILTGRESITTPKTWTWQQACLETFLFIAVAAAGIALGSEYRRRIHHLKKHRVTVAPQRYRQVYPKTSDRKISEIQVLYVMLVCLSSAGIFIAWLNIYTYDWLFYVFIAWSGLLIMFGAYWVWRSLGLSLAAVTRWFLGHRKSSE